EMILEKDEEATRTGILTALDRLAKQAGPEDRCIVFLAGHGLFQEIKGTKDELTRTEWFFVCPDFDVNNPQDSSITSKDLYEKLAAIQGRKVVILDACHSGEAATRNPVRQLVPGG